LRAFSEGICFGLWPPSREITDDAIDALMRYSWPGNVRELRNVIERIVIMNPTTRDLSASICRRWSSRRQPPCRGARLHLHQARAAYERDYILKKLDENHGNVSRTAEVLGLERSHLYRKMKSAGDCGEGVGAGRSLRHGKRPSSVVGHLHFG
jgi:two-component system, NtrC family, nitrogen regulation response regulator NtrX